MQNFTITTNADSRIEAFYIDVEDDGVIMHTWQVSPNDKTLWSRSKPLGDRRNSLKNVSRFAATTDSDGQIHVVAFTGDDKYHVCQQILKVGSLRWSEWKEIRQDK